MVMFEGEQMVLEADNKTLTVTTHRVRYVARGSGSTKLVSMMLEAVTSCEVTHTTRPLFLVLGGFLLFAGVMSSSGQKDSTPSAIGFVLALVFAVAYLATRRQVVRISSPSAHIDVLLAGMSLDQATEVVDAIEGAKDARCRRR